MALSQSNSASGNVTDIAEARRNRGQARTDVSGQPNGPPGAVLTAAEAEDALKDELASSKAPPDKNGNRRFDKEKVERIKAEIAEGRYQIDHVRVADKFIEHERNS